MSTSATTSTHSLEDYNNTSSGSLNGQQQQQQSKNIRRKIGDFLNSFFKRRPSPDELRDRNILMPPGTPSHSRKNSTTSSRGKKSTGDLSMNDQSQPKRSAWEYLRNLDFTFSKFTFGKTVVHRLKFPQFGLSPSELQDLYPDQPDGIPLVLTKGIEYLMNHLDTEGLFRVPGSNKEISLLKFRIEDGDLDFSAVLNPYCICGLISSFFKELPDPLIPCDNYKEAMNCVKDNNLERIASSLARLVLNVPPSHLCILRKFMEFLSVIERNKHRNKMTSENLGIIFGPTLMRDPDFTDIGSGLANLKNQSLVVKYMVELFDPIFKSKEVKSAYRKSMKILPPVDSSSIEYLDPASVDTKRDSGQVHVIANGTQTQRPRPPPRRTGTILLSPRRDDNTTVFTMPNHATMPRPVSRIFNPEVLESPPRPPKPPSRKPLPVGRANLPKSPPPSAKYLTLPSRRISNLNDDELSALQTTTTTTTTSSSAATSTHTKPPLPPSSSSTTATSSTHSHGTLRNKPIVPKPSPLPSPSPSPTVNRNANNTHVQVHMTSSFDRPPNKPPPTPNELKSKTTPIPPPRTGAAEPPPPQPTPPTTKKRVQFEEHATDVLVPPTKSGVNTQPSQQQQPPRSSTLPRSFSKQVVVAPPKPLPKTPGFFDPPVTTQSPSPSPTPPAPAPFSAKTLTPGKAPPPKSHSFIASSSIIKDDPTKTMPKSSKSASALSLSGGYVPPPRVAQDEPSSSSTPINNQLQFRMLQPLRVSPDVKHTTTPLPQTKQQLKSAPQRG
ncbi:hypothetical protein SAMD00019534_024910 [Acytostelium subglobosum LB1]|uniref:hypothetical protein n=1 Tax=Acytostelium subglobosum LB1 TaxID=1410327 RepID=UPI000645053F|nr:hypothetical protein SAMD00019534_024910 [Acytostelium subglobosum LB1]GAM19316.1 hypothetical protein SAMD00019534_024910 [Acytostelium subglobosum LB1]|eukprot:XP_012757243.1 hypothetical protein SAMD00019534_024910 [Acytostelium subglobosum LB1]